MSRIGGAPNSLLYSRVKCEGVAVPHVVSSACGVDALAQHETASLLQPHLLLELQGAHRSDRLEVVVEARDAHPELACDVLDSQRLVEFFAEPL